MYLQKGIRIKTEQDPDQDPSVKGTDPGSGSIPNVTDPIKWRKKTKDVLVHGSVADPGCLSRIPDPDFYPSRILDPGSKNSTKRGVKIFVCQTFFCSHKFHKM